MLAMLDSPDPDRFELPISSDTRKLFPKNGIYRKGPSGWKLDWVLPYRPPCYGVEFSQDGKSVLLYRDDTTHTVSNIPVGAFLDFYHSNGENRLWQEWDMTWGWFLKAALNRLLNQPTHLEWTTANRIPSSDEFLVKTNQGEEFVFDLRTGDLIRSRSTWSRAALLLGVATLAMTLFLSRPRARAIEPQSKMHYGFAVGELLATTTMVAILMVIGSQSLKLLGLALAAACSGGLLALPLSLTRRAAMLGSILSVCYASLSLIFSSMICEPLLWELKRIHDGEVLGVFLTAIFIGVLIGAILGGLIARSNQPICPEPQAIRS
ncbi:MAG: hypothetical protein AAGA92_07590 [Planctomycetota bacterium]